LQEGSAAAAAQKFSPTTKVQVSTTAAAADAFADTPLELQDSIPGSAPATKSEGGIPGGNRLGREGSKGPRPAKFLGRDNDRTLLT